jgi:thymidylate kinase
VIIVEGPDGAGKTTLVEHLAGEFNIKVGERGVADRDKLYTVTRSDTYNALGLAVRGNLDAKIWDRLFFSEMVYAPVVGRECEFSTEEQIFVRRILTCLGCPIIVCLPPWEVVKANVAGSKQMDGVEENLKHIYAAYQRVCEGMPWVMFYDYTHEQRDAGYVGIDHLRTGIKHYLDDRKVRETV